MDAMFLKKSDLAGGEIGILQHNPVASNSLYHRQYLSDPVLLKARKFQFAAKRVVDVFVASAALLVLLPFLLFVAALIRLDSPGPVIFTQLRWGWMGRKIKIYKFRTMRADLCDPSGVTQTVIGDRRVTRFGAFLRRYNIDELPQLINILRGDMSIVGPRCHAIGMLAAGRIYEDLVPAYHLRHLVRPGLTGLAQIRGLRGPTDNAVKSRIRVAADLYYVGNFSLWLDFKIMCVTLLMATRLRGI